MVSSSGFEDDDYFYVPSLGKTKNSAVKHSMRQEDCWPLDKGAAGNCYLLTQEIPLPTELGERDLAKPPSKIHSTAGI